MFAFRHILLLTALLIGSLGCFGQDEVFTDINHDEHLTKRSPVKLLYYHLPTCSPCKRMDRDVLSDPGVQRFLSDNFDCYSVFGLDSLTREYRRKYEVTTNPAFVFLDKNNKVIHRFVGYRNKERFVEDCQQVLPGSGR
jgi:thioredoxin-related protein